MIDSVLDCSAAPSNDDPLTAEGNRLRGYRYLAPFESIEGFRKIVKYFNKKGIQHSEVGLICIRDEIIRSLRHQFPEFNILSVDRADDLAESRNAANVFVTKLTPLLIREAKKSEFLWSILFNLHTEYLLHLSACLYLADKLIDSTQPEQIWILISDGMVYGLNSGAGDRNPVFFLSMIALIKKRKRQYLNVGSVLHKPRMFFAVHVILLLANVGVFFFLWLVTNVCSLIMTPFRLLLAKLGPNPIEAGNKVLSVNESIRWVDDWVSTLPKNNNTVSICHMKYLEIGLPLLFRSNPSAKNWWRYLEPFDLIIRIAKLGWRSKDELLIGRLDKRMGMSCVTWFFFYTLPRKAIRIRAVARVVGTLAKEVGAVGAVLEAVFWEKAPTKSTDLINYTKLIIWGYAVNFVYSSLLVNYLQREYRPTLVVYPSGYDVLIRILQWRASTGTYRSIEIPHGTPNRIFPSYYCNANSYLSPTEMSREQLRCFGVTEDVNRAVKKNEYHSDESKQDPNRISSHLMSIGKHSSSGQESLKLGIVYSGSGTPWSFPNCFRQLWDMSNELIGRLMYSIPDATIILKSHPNGTSHHFFHGLRSNFEAQFEEKKLIHNSEQWKGDEFGELRLGFCLITYCSSGLLYCLKRGVPMILIAETPPPNETIFYPSLVRLNNYPYIFQSIEEAVDFARTLLLSEESYNDARNTMRDVRKKLIYRDIDN